MIIKKNVDAEVIERWLRMVIQRLGTWWLAHLAEKGYLLEIEKSKHQVNSIRTWYSWHHDYPNGDVGREGTINARRIWNKGCKKKEVRQ